MNRCLDSRPVAIVLGGTFPHIALIENLQKRGYYVILVDYYANPPAKAVADEHLQESTLDNEKVLEIARNRQASLVITTCIDQANVTACYVAEKLHLPAPYTYQTALAVTNKRLMKERMAQHGIPTSKYIFVRDHTGIESTGLQFPVIVKPVDSNSSKGVRKALNQSELSRFLDEALKISRSDEAIIEEYKEGREIGVDCFINNKEATVLMTKERRKVVMPAQDAQEQQIYGCIWPTELTERNLIDLKHIAENIASAFDLDNTPLMMQVIVNGTDINVIEFGARIGGGESFRIIKLITGFDYVDAAVNSFLGLPVVLDYKVPDVYYAENFIYSRAGIFGRISGHETLLKNNLIEYLDSYKTTGMEVGSELSSNNRVGVFAVKSTIVSELQDKIDTALQNIEVYDVHGKPMMRKDIYSYKPA